MANTNCKSVASDTPEPNRKVEENAVNIPYASTGNLTAYLAPVDQVDHLAYNLDYKLIDDEHDLAFIGYDAYNSAPFDKDTMASIYFEDEVEELGIYG